MYHCIVTIGPTSATKECLVRLKESGFTDEQTNRIFGPIGIKLGGRSAPEIALSIIAQLVAETYKK